FRLAHHWGCILLDEADVFLDKREHQYIARNGLVAVFLRVLEYYSGILFLTTNRVGFFDEAFQSRMYISLYYPPLSKESTFAIWNMKPRRIKARSNLISKEEKIKEFYQKHYKEGNRWNGCQIRNAFQTAVALAEFKHL
ncbi:hypothetical protein B0J14DRAFT_458817, partial [Halenospora varia]